SSSVSRCLKDATTRPLPALCCPTSTICRKPAKAWTRKAGASRWSISMAAGSTRSLHDARRPAAASVHARGRRPAQSAKGGTSRPRNLPLLSSGGLGFLNVRVTRGLERLGVPGELVEHLASRVVEEVEQIGRASCRERIWWLVNAELTIM